MSGFLSGPVSPQLRAPPPQATLAAQIPGPCNQQELGLSWTRGHKQPLQRGPYPSWGSGPPTWACRTWRPQLRGDAHPDDGSFFPFSSLPQHHQLASPHPPPTPHSLSRAPDPNRPKPPAPKTPWPQLECLPDLLKSSVLATGHRSAQGLGRNPDSPHPTPHPPSSTAGLHPVLPILSPSESSPNLSPCPVLAWPLLSGSLLPSDPTTSGPRWEGPPPAHKSQPADPRPKLPRGVPQEDGEGIASSAQLVGVYLPAFPPAPTHPTPSRRKTC